jgi:hypothetical protein
LIRQAAQGEVLHNDETSMRILHLARAPDDEPTGLFTSGVVSVAEGRRIAFFFTGRQHSGSARPHCPRRCKYAMRRRATPRRIRKASRSC